MLCSTALKASPKSVRSVPVVASHLVQSMPSMNGANTSALRVDTLNPKVLNAEYAVRGEIVIRAGEIQKELNSGGKKPFSSVLYCNIGNPQQLGQLPVTFFRQVLALCDYPTLLENPKVDELFPPDVLERARRYLKAIPGGTGAYSDSRGAGILRQEVAKGIERRDGYPADADSIYMSDGASQSVHALMRMLIRDENDAVLVPIPQYPLYSATLALYGGTLLPYYLKEDHEWGLDLQELHDQTKKAQAEGKTVRAIVIINPGNPTGQVLTQQNQEDIVKFCRDESIVLAADEVYQDNIYVANKEFHSFKKVMRKMGVEDVALASMHSISKGFYGECGRRGGYTEFVGFDKDVLAQLYKLASINLCSNINGQICTALMMQPPKEGEPSYALYAKERESLLASLKRRAEKLHAALCELRGVTCNPSEGALYAMPRIRLPPAALEAAKKAGKAPDFFYCMQLLEETGIVTVPGSGFQQEEGTYHFRTTILVQERETDEVIDRLKAFHNGFMEEYSK